MFSLRQNFQTPSLPSGFVLEINKPLAPEALNRLLARCNQDTHPPRKLALAIKKSSFHLSIFDISTSNLSGFVRVTSDIGLNANIWDLVAIPGGDQRQLIEVLVHRTLAIIRRDMPGCSISVAASSMAIDALKGNGFVIDPGGIRAMGLRLR